MIEYFALDLIMDDEGVCRVPEEHCLEWAYVPHFYLNFYVYQYATSFTASTALSEKIGNDESLVYTVRAGGYYGITEPAFLQEVEKALQVGTGRGLFEIFNDVELDVTVAQDIQRTPGLASGGIVVDE